MVSIYKFKNMKSIKEFLYTSLKNYKWFWMALTILLVTNLYFYASNRMTIKKHNKELTQTKVHYEKELRLSLDKNAKEQLSLMLKTFVWAVRSSMIRNNMDEVDQYFTELIREENIYEIVLVGNDGKIRVSTNKKHQTKPFSSFYPTRILAQPDIFFTHSEDSLAYYVAAPVLSLNNRLGTLFLVYGTTPINLETTPLSDSPALAKTEEVIEQEVANEAEMDIPVDSTTTE